MLELGGWRLSGSEKKALNLLGRQIQEFIFHINIARKGVLQRFHRFLREVFMDLDEKNPARLGD